ncbi:MAG: hypothetical protein ABFS19_14630 [Thermodesulfobacteriota bacterium]
MGRDVAACLVLVCFLTMAASLVILSGHTFKTAGVVEGKKQLQSSLGGVGMGSVVVPAWNFGDFDPRLQPAGYDQLYPIPGGYSYSPDRLSMVSHFPAR